MDKVTFLKSWQKFITQQDSNSCTLEFSSSLDPHMINQALRSLLIQLDQLFSDYQIKIAKTSEHPNIQIQMRLEERIWKPK